MNAAAFRRWYESRNLTQREVAGLLGIGQKRVSSMATGKSPVSRQTARMLVLVELLECYEEESGYVARSISADVDLRLAKLNAP